MVSTTQDTKIKSTVNSISKIKQALGHNDFNINVNNTDSRIYIKNTSDQQKLLNDLAKNKVDHFTFAGNDQKVKN